MRFDFIPKLRCPACNHHHLSYEVFDQHEENVIHNGVVWCPACSTWYSVSEGLLELLPLELAYLQDRNHFWHQFKAQLENLGLRPAQIESVSSSDFQLQKIQQDHFDWYASNDKQSYSEYEQTPFWLAADRLAFDPWKAQIQPHSWLLEVGCAQGRATFNFVDLPIKIMGFDISKHLVRQAIERYRSAKFAADACFFVGDGHNLPLNNASFDYVLIYGVLHHLPDPGHTCADVARVLKPGGTYFGSENNSTIFRGIFELLQRINPLWHEEAGPEALISKQNLHAWFDATEYAIELQTRTSVFLPPHIFGLMPNSVAFNLLRFTDRLAGSLPFVRNNGGLILFLCLKGKLP